MQQRKLATNRIALMGIMLAFAIIVSFIESSLPPIIPALPYAKIGFSNIILLTVLLLLGYRACLIVLVLKCVIVGIFIGNPFSMVYSIPAGIISYTIMALFMKVDKLSITSVSTIGSILHNFVQIIVASFVIGKTIWLILPYLLLLGSIAGIAIGIITFVLLKYLPINHLVKFSKGDKLKSSKI